MEFIKKTFITPTKQPAADTGVAKEIKFATPGAAPLGHMPLGHWLHVASWVGGIGPLGLLVLHIFVGITQILQHVDRCSNSLPMGWLLTTPPNPREPSAIC